MRKVSRLNQLIPVNGTETNIANVPFLLALCLNQLIPVNGTETNIANVPFLLALCLNQLIPVNGTETWWSLLSNS